MANAGEQEYRQRHPALPNTEQQNAITEPTTTRQGSIPTLV
jgi:hypothetical protein